MKRICAFIEVSSSSVMPGTPSTNCMKTLQVLIPWKIHDHSLWKMDVLGVACPVRMVRVSGLPRCS